MLSVSKEGEQVPTFGTLIFMLIINKTKFLEIRKNGLFFYDGKEKEIPLYNKEIWTKIITWYEAPRDENDIPSDILSGEEIRGIIKALKEVKLLIDYELPEKRTERIENFYKTYNATSKQVKKQKILIWGCGTVGASVIENLGKMDFEHFILVDSDIVDEKNVIAQSIFRYKDVGKLKIRVIEEFLRTNISEKINIYCEETFINNFGEFQSIFDLYQPDVVIDCADGKERQLDLEVIQLAAEKEIIYLSTGYANDKNYIFKISQNYTGFINFMENNWIRFGENIRFISNRGTIIDSNLLGSLSARLLINHVLKLNSKDYLIELNLLSMSLRELEF